MVQGRWGKTHADGLVLHVTQTEQLVEWSVRAISDGVLSGPGQVVESVEDRWRGL